MLGNWSEKSLCIHVMRKLQSNTLVFDIMYGNGCGTQAFKNKSSVDFSIRETERGPIEHNQCSLSSSGFKTINVLYLPGGPLGIKSIWNGINKIAIMIIMHLRRTDRWTDRQTDLTDISISRAPSQS